MPTITIQVDDSMLEAAGLVGVALQKRGYSEHAPPPEHVFHSAINLGLARLMETWCAGVPFHQSEPVLAEMQSLRTATR